MWHKLVKVAVEHPPSTNVRIRQTTLQTLSSQRKHDLTRGGHDKDLEKIGILFSCRACPFHNLRKMLI